MASHTYHHGVQRTRQAGLYGLALALCLWGAAQAAPTPWYWWVSKVDGQRVCAQHLPAQGWERAEGPFSLAGCQARRPQPLLGGAPR